MDRLRSPGGCPWDAEQTHASLAPYLVEEAHEVLEAIEAGDLGRSPRSSATSCSRWSSTPGWPRTPGRTASTSTPSPGLLVEKLVRRHPHVFADGDASTPEQVEQEWERIKAEEKAANGGGYAEDLLHGMPASLPPELAARKVLARVRRRGLTPDPAALDRLESARAVLAEAETQARQALRDLADSASGDVPGDGMRGP